MNNAAYAALGSGVVGVAAQWFLFGPKKIPAWVAWGAVSVASVLGFIYATPVSDLSIADWKEVILKFSVFLTSTKGWGALAKAAKLAPATDSI